MIQRVKCAGVTVQEEEVARIGKGLLLLVGIAKDDSTEDAEYLSGKIMNLRIFGDEKGKMNLSIRQAGGQVLSVSQFTLYADTGKGNRPGFELSAPPEEAKQQWERFNHMLRGGGLDVKEGVFGAHMEVELINDGPVTIWMDSRSRK